MPKDITSAHYDGKRFWNLDRNVSGDKSFFDVLKWRMTAQRAEWPSFIDDALAPDVVTRNASDSLRVTFINHATLMIQTHGINLITDPVFSKRASPFTFMGPKRVRAPGLAIDALPPIDAVLISHSHYDHLDKASLETIETKFAPQYYVPLNTADLMPKATQDAGRVTEMDWWQTETLRHGSSTLSLAFTPAQHWTARTLWDKNERFWGGFAVMTPAGTVYFAGDTGYAAHFRDVAEKFGPVRLALLPIGAYEPRWFMAQQHMDPAEAVRAHKDLSAARSIGIHLGTFQLTDEAIDAPIRDLERARDAAGMTAAEFIAPRNGEVFVFD